MSALDEVKLLTCGFERADGCGFSRTLQILGDEYAAVVRFSDGGEPNFLVFDGDGEEYLLASVHNATSSFVGRVHLPLTKTD